MGMVNKFEMRDMSRILVCRNNVMMDRRGWFEMVAGGEGYPCGDLGFVPIGLRLGWAMDTDDTGGSAVMREVRAIRTRR